MVNIACVLKALGTTTKKGSQLFEEKVHPPRENPGYACVITTQTRYIIQVTKMRCR